MITYLNMKTAYGVETVDEINSEDFNTLQEYITERRLLMHEYRLAGMNVYRSSRCTKAWKES